MNRKNSIILMADILNSRDYDLYALMVVFKKVTETINKEFQSLFLSPITITLGDEFQCVFKNLSNAVSIIISVEEELLRQQLPFKLRYVVLEGEIETKINKENGYGMMGTGLIAARERLAQIKSKKNRFHFFVSNNEKNELLSDAFIVFQDYVDGWDPIRDYPTVVSFLSKKDYKLVAAEMKKTQSQLWKREKTLHIESFFSIKKLINYISAD